MDGLEAELAEVSGRLDLARAGLERLRIARETVAEVLAEMTPAMPAVAVDAGQRPAAERVVWAYGGSQRQAVGVLTVPGLVRAKQIVPRIGLPASAAKIQGTRSKLKRLVERGWLSEGRPGLFRPRTA